MVPVEENRCGRTASGENCHRRIGAVKIEVVVAVLVLPCSYPMHGGFIARRYGPENAVHVVGAVHDGVDHPGVVVKTLVEPAHRMICYADAVGAQVIRRILKPDLVANLYAVQGCAGSHVHHFLGDRHAVSGAVFYAVSRGSIAYFHRCGRKFSRVNCILKADESKVYNRHFDSTARDSLVLKVICVCQEYAFRYVGSRSVGKLERLRGNLRLPHLRMRGKGPKQPGGKHHADERRGNRLNVYAAGRTPDLVEFAGRHPYSGLHDNGKQRFPARRFTQPHAVHSCFAQSRRIAQRIECLDYRIQAALELFVANLRFCKSGTYQRDTHQNPCYHPCNIMFFHRLRVPTAQQVGEDQ